MKKLVVAIVVVLILLGVSLGISKAFIKDKNVDSGIKNSEVDESHQEKEEEPEDVDVTERPEIEEDNNEKEPEVVEEPVNKDDKKPSNNNNNNNNGNKDENKQPANDKNDKEDNNKKPDLSSLSLEEKVDYQMKNMTLDQKIAQMIIIETNGTSMSDTLKKNIKDNKIGGVILFSKNITSYNQVTSFIDSMQNSADIPLFMAVDQEGGTVQRLKKLNEATRIPDMCLLGKTNDADLSYQVGQVIGEEIRAVGFNVDFAPVLDIATVEGDVSYRRSFGNNPELVAKMGVSLAKGLESKNVVPVYKHFPGHGGTVVDSHFDLPVLNKTKEELLNNDLVPFKKGIDEGAKMIMIGHLAIPNITNDKTPASLSKVLITDLLKNELGFNGLVITDSLVMEGLTKNYSEKQIYEMAINAGVDVLLMPKSVNSAITNIKQSIKDGKITEEQINSSVRKILTLKYSTLKTERLSKSYLGSKSHLDIINKIK